MISGPARTELRKDPTSGQWVLVRNWTPQPRGDNVCPFCPGHESETPPEIAAFRTNGQLPNSSEWLVRVIPDMAPLLQIEGDIQREGLGLYDSVSGRGASELVIEHPVHGAVWDHLPAEDVERVLWMYRARVEDLYQDAQIRSVLIRRREHSLADPITHPFSRIFGAPIVFDDLRRELAAARQHFIRKQRCLYCDIIHQERQDGRRVVMETSSFLVYTPYGARRPFETWLVPTTHRHSYTATSPGELGDLSRTLQAAFRRLRAVQPSVPVDLTLHTAPNAKMRLREDEWRSLLEDYHWHIELAPDRKSREDIGGFAVNPLPPEEAARQLRNAL